MALGTTSSQAGLIISLIFTVVAVLLVAISSPRSGDGLAVTMPLTSFLGMICFLALGWMPQTLGAIIALVCSLFVVKVVLT